MREQREREKVEKQQTEREREEARRAETPQTEEAVADIRPRTERSEMNTEGGGETGTSTQFQSRCKKGHMTNIYLTDSDKEVIVYFVKDHELYGKINKNFKDKARKDCKQPQSVNEGLKDLVQIPKDSLWKTNPVQVWPDSQGNDREAELDSGQI